MDPRLSRTVFVKSGKNIVFKDCEQLKKKKLENKVPLKNKKEIAEKIKEITQLLNEVKELVRN